jgi:hypothetical protein
MLGSCEMSSNNRQKVQIIVLMTKHGIRDIVKCTTKIEINIINLTLRAGLKDNKSR